MDGGQVLDERLDYVEFHIFPSQNRYEASVWSSNREENLAFGPLEQLLLHSSEIKNLSFKIINTKFKILPPNNINDASWFTTPTLKRFLHVIGLPDIVTIAKEISQLEETRKFSISSSDKSEILVAVDLRLTALKDELSVVLNQTIGSKYSLNDISDIGNFALHFGAIHLRDSLQKSIELSLIEEEEDSSSKEEDSQRQVKNNVLRMSVQDKISLFESKQRDQGAVNVQKTNVTVTANKAVLRRWSSGMGERCDESLNSPENIGPDVKTETDNNNNSNNDDNPKTETCPEKEISEELGVEVDKVDEIEEISHEKNHASIEWSREKECVTSDKRKEEKLQKQAAGKSKIVSTNVTGANRRHQNEPQKKSTQSMNSRTTMKKPTRKSSSPQPATGTASANSTPTNRKPQSPASENLQPRLKTTTIKSTKPVANQKIKATNEKKLTSSTENRKTTSTKVQTPANLTTKPNKVTKRNSVVPIEPKPFLRKGSGIGPGVGPVVIKSRVEETSKTSDNPIQSKVDIMIINHEMETESETSKNLEPEVVQIEQSEICGDLGLELSEINDVTEEKVEIEISPNAWVEMENEDDDEEEENHEDEIIPFQESESPIEIGITLPRVRHSLSQMLLEETNESDISEWGNDSHPPTLIYHKDAPRGLKRLLKFARKAKADTHITAWSSPEGDDDFEESKATRSFFSLSAFRGNKTNETKFLHR